MVRLQAFLPLLALLLLPVALAEESVIHDEWHSYSDFFTVDNDYYEVANAHVIEGSVMMVRTLLKRNQASHIVTGEIERVGKQYYLSEELCETSGLLRFCVVNVSLDPEKGARADESGHYWYGTRIKIYEEEADAAVLELTRTIVGGTTLHYADEQKVTVTLKNTGTKSAEDVRFEEVVGECLAITRVDGLTRIGRRLSADIPILYADRQETLSYWVRPDAYCNESWLNATATYDSPEPETLEDDQKVTIPWPYKASFTISDDEVGLGVRSDFTFTIENEEEADIDVAFSLIHPLNVIATDPSGLQEVTKNRLAYEESIRPGGKVTLTARLSSANAYVYDLIGLLKVTVKGVEFAETFTEELRVNADGKTSYNDVEPNLLLNKETMRSGETLTIGVYLKNTDDKYRLYRVDGWVGSAFFNESFSIPSLSASENVNVLFKTYYPPEVHLPTTYLVEVKGTYDTPEGFTYPFHEKSEVLILPENMSVVLTQQTDKKELLRGEELTVTIKAKNLADSGYNQVRVEDSYDPDLELTFGKDKGDVYLYGGEEVQVYVYKLRVPFGYYKGNFTVTSTLAAQGQPLLSFSEEVKVLDPLDPGTLPVEEEPVDDADTSASDADDTLAEDDDGTLADDDQEDASTDDNDDGADASPAREKEGFFSHLINGIADFFARFFS
ncbi:hypothetical protein JXA12_03735 [Candidatus Woesearchaeota archaeon]|nr:hypothetical protein [Candidatus Woesearchaeota archaeon]